MWTGVGHSRFSFLVRSLNDVAPLELRSSICAGHLGPEAISPKDLSTMMVSSRIACRSSRLRQANNNASKSGRRTNGQTDVFTGLPSLAGRWTADGRIGKKLEKRFGRIDDVVMCVYGVSAYYESHTIMIENGPGLEEHLWPPSIKQRKISVTFIGRGFEFEICKNLELQLQTFGHDEHYWIRTIMIFWKDRFVIVGPWPWTWSPAARYNFSLFFEVSWEL